MDQLLPTSRPDVDPADVVSAEARERRPGRAWVLTNFVVGLDGGIEVDGRSGPLGSPGDRSVFRAIRSVADVVLVGAATARAERYRLPVDDTGRVAPRLCVVSRSLDLDPALPFLDHDEADRDRWPLVVTVAGADAVRRHALAQRAEVVTLPGTDVTPQPLLDALVDRGLDVVLCEGGPSLLAQLDGAGLVDEWNLTVAPMVAGGSSRRLTPPDRPAGTPMRLDRLLVEDGHLFARYLTR